MHRSKNGRFRLADRPADCKRLGIAPVEIAEFEYGQHIDTEKGLARLADPRYYQPDSGRESRRTPCTRALVDLIT
jgi:hypothetical protein